jgi:hypothetical protein
MPAKSVEDRAAKITATGFLMVGDIEIVNPDKAKMETDHIDTQVIKIGQTFLGMTLGCVRCHDHKFDPIGLEDYYGIAGMLRSSPSSHKMPDMGVWSTLNSTALPETPAQLAARKKLEAENEQRIADWKAEQKKLSEEKATITKQLAAVGKATASTPQATATDNAEREVAPAPEAKPAHDKDALTKRRDELDAQIKKLDGSIKHAEFFKDKTPRAFAMADSSKPADMPIYVRGNPYAPSSVVPRGAVRVASWERFSAIPAGQSGRLQLANWLADKRNPLTARVTVNRIWQKLFDNGIVPSVDYFGARGDVPTHPELLDHLAARFMRGGWSQKQFIRALVLSRTYRLSSANQAAAMKLDPENKLYWRMNRQRLDAEALRDSLLARSSGPGSPCWPRRASRTRRSPTRWAATAAGSPAGAGASWQAASPPWPGKSPAPGASRASTRRPWCSAPRRPPRPTPPTGACASWHGLPPSARRACGASGGRTVPNRTGCVPSS